MSIYRNGFQVSPERIAVLSDAELSYLMGRLIHAQSHLCRSSIAQIRINTEGSAKDDGCDGWSETPELADEWLGGSCTCWQFKAGTAGQQAKLKGEVTKRIPKETLASYGRFVVVASASNNGKKGDNARLKVLVAEASDAGLPADEIAIFGSEPLTTWCNQHPAIAAEFAGRPSGMLTLAEWQASHLHRTPWQPSAAGPLQIADRRLELDFEGSNLSHLHIHGHPGVGKTRFALELCRDAPWRDFVVYIPQASVFPTLELITSAAREKDVRLIVVADEVQEAQLRSLREAVGLGQGRIKLITIGHCVSPDPKLIPALQVKPNPDDVMRLVIKGAYESMPLEHVSFVAKFSGGFVRLAILAADAVVQSPGMNVHGLLGRDAVRKFLDNMLGDGDRKSLYVVAVLAHVGWSGELEIEGRTIAEHFGLDWNVVRYDVDRFQQRFGVAPQGGRYRYISPSPLGAHLAVEAWNVYPAECKSLPSVLPAGHAVDAYYDRLRTIASNPEAREHAIEELTFFFRLSDFISERGARTWSALSAANPDDAARKLFSALSAASVDERRELADRARREIVWTLVRIAWRSPAFHDAVMALALLAEAENESFSNNATGEFLDKFQVSLGGTAAPYISRLDVLDELLLANRRSLDLLVIRALAKVGDRHAYRMVHDAPSDEVPEKEWNPTSAADYLACIEAAFRRLTDLASQGIAELRDHFMTAANDVAMMLRDKEVRLLVAQFFTTIRDSFPETREPLRRVIAYVVNNERNHWKELDRDELSELDDLEAQFSDASLEGRLLELVGPDPWSRSEQPNLEPLASELTSSTDVLAHHWNWLTSGEASDAFRLGHAIARVDVDGIIENVIAELSSSGGDMRVVCGYVHRMREANGDAWYDGWIAAIFDRTPTPIDLLLETAWRCGVTENFAEKIGDVIKTEKPPAAVVEKLIYGQLARQLSPESLRRLLEALRDAGYGKVAIAILADRLKTDPDELNSWSGFALSLSRDTALIKDGGIAKHYWKEISLQLVPNHARELSAAIFEAQTESRSDAWFIDYDEAEEVLRSCAEREPEGVWQNLTLHLESGSAAYSFVIGLPDWLLKKMPSESAMRWVAEQPAIRAPLIAKLADKDFTDDSSVVSQVLGEYGDDENVASAFFGTLITGSWSGSSSAHWNKLAKQIDEASHNTKLPKLRSWASTSAGHLRAMALRDQKREEEEDILGN